MAISITDSHYKRRLSGLDSEMVYHVEFNGDLQLLGNVKRNIVELGLEKVQLEWDYVGGDFKSHPPLHIYFAVTAAADHALALQNAQAVDKALPNAYGLNVYDTIETLAKKHGVFTIPGDQGVTGTVTRTAPVKSV